MLVVEPTPQEIADDIDRQIKEADREAQEAAYAFALGKFPEYWEAYLGKAEAALEKTYVELAG